MSVLRSAQALLLASESYLRAVFVLVGAALALALGIAGFTLLSLVAAAGAPAWATALTGVVLVGGPLLAGVVPAVRQVEGVAVQSLLAVEFPDGVPGPAAGWPQRRRTLAWFLLHMGTGAVVVAAVLTGVFNRRWLMESLQAIHDERRGAVASMIFIDVDHFKHFNDSFGHLVGDQALRSVAETIGRCLPADAVLARYGGEEFACLLPDAELPAAHELAEKIRTEVAQHAAHDAARTARQITISVGVACRRLESEADVEILLRKADEAQYEAKRAGRNCVRDAPPGA